MSISPKLQFPFNKKKLLLVIARWFHANLYIIRSPLNQAATAFLKNLALKSGKVFNLEIPCYIDHLTELL